MYLRGGEKGLIFVSNIYLRKIYNILSKSNEECKPVIKESFEFRFGYVHGIIIVERGS